MSHSDDLFGDDPDLEKFAQEFERHRHCLHDFISEYMDEEQLDEAYAGQLLIEAAIRMRMTAYGIGVEKPSVAGLKLDLDRLRRELEEFIREAKKGAEEFIQEVKELRAIADAEAKPK